MQQPWAAQQRQQPHRYHHQHTASMPSLQDLIAVHQKQWQEHLVMTGNASNDQQTEENTHHIFSPPISPPSDISSNDTNYSQRYIMSQQQYRRQQNTSYSSRNLTNYQRSPHQQQQPQQPQHSQRQHRRHASMGHIKMTNNNAFNTNYNKNNMINTQQITLQQHQRRKSMHRDRQRHQSMGHLKLNINTNNINNDSINNKYPQSPPSPHSPRLFQQQETRNNVYRNRLHSTGHVKMSNNYYNVNTNNNSNKQQIQKQPPRQQQQQQQKQYHSRYSLHSQQTGNDKNDKNRFQRYRFGSTGQLKQNKDNYKKHKIYHSSNAIEQLEEEEEEEEEFKDHRHETFVPPPPQNTQEVRKYINWKAKREGISDQKEIDQEFVRISTKHSKRNSFDENDIYDKQTINSNVICESFLSKKGKINKSMQVRYCIAYKDRKLKYFRKATDKNAAGFIDLSQVFKINMYLPKLTKSKKNDIVDLNKLKNDGMCPLYIRSIALKGNNKNYGFELVTNKRVWTFSCRDFNIFKQWIESVKHLCFGKSLHSGYLRKVGQKNKSWKRRFFVLYDSKEMRYFEDETMRVQKGKIDLNKVTKVLEAKPNKYPKYDNCMELHTEERIWILASDTNQQREIWINLIANI